MAINNNVAFIICDFLPINFLPLFFMPSSFYYKTTVLPQRTRYKMRIFFPFAILGFMDTTYPVCRQLSISLMSNFVQGFV